MEIGVVERPFLGEEESGDAYFVRDYADKTLLALIDGLGHGPRATQVSRKAFEYLNDHFRDDLSEIMWGCHRALKKTRGAAVGLILLDSQVDTLTFVGVGNVEVRVVGEKSHSFVSVRGIVGYNLRKVRPEVVSYQPGDLIVMHTDGLSAKFNLDQYPGLRKKDPQRIAETIFQDHAREHDDATILVGRVE